MNRSHLSIKMIVLVTALLLVPGIADAQRIISQDENRIVWRIDAPAVTKPYTNYPSVQFRPLDEVFVEAGGCAQTGGSGATWKRYVNPTGQNSDRLYHGRISIPGATAGLVRISSITGPYRGQPLHLVVDKLPSHYDGSPLFLQLGYEDENYGDNGYWGHDDGTGGQCKAGNDGGNAWVNITILHHDARNPPPPSPSPRAPMDLAWDRVDENFLPLNPAWGYQLINKGAPPPANQICKDFHNEGDALPMGKSLACTLWDPDVDERSTVTKCFPKAGTVAGHINWAAATYAGGRVYFKDYSDKLLNDFDYNIGYISNDLRGVAVPTDIQYEGMPGLMLEFDAKETVDLMNGTGTWWERFRNVVNRDQNAARGMLQGQEAIAIGLLGLDHEHDDVKAELHPVYGLAIHVENTPDADVWAVFARNWGNEGACSNRAPTDHNLRLRNNQMTFFIPKPPGAEFFRPTVNFKANYATAAYGARAVNDGVLLTITLPEPEIKGIAWGELRIEKKRSR